MKPYDLTEVFNTEIEPLLRKLADISVKHELPMLAVFGYYRRSIEQDYDTGCYVTMVPRYGEFPPCMELLARMADEMVEIFGHGNPIQTN